jgi:hypothetical protein
MVYCCQRGPADVAGDPDRDGVVASTVGGETSMARAGST